MGMIKDKFKQKAEDANTEIKALLKEHGNKITSLSLWRKSSA